MITLPARIEALIQAKVESGAYPDAGAVVEEALRLLQWRDEEAKLERWRAAAKLGFDQLDRGEGVLYTPELHDQIIETARRRAR